MGLQLSEIIQSSTLVLFLGKAWFPGCSAVAFDVGPALFDLISTCAMVTAIDEETAVAESMQCKFSII